MAAKTLYLTNTSAGAAFPTGALQLSETPPGVAVSLGPGEFDSGLPGNTDAGQWNPGLPIANTTAAAEINNAAGATPSTNRRGWVWNVDLTGQTLDVAGWAAQLRLDALQGSGSGSILIRVSIVTAAGGVLTTIAQIFTTNILGEASHTAGQDGWTASTATITPTTTEANHSVAFPNGATHTFASGERMYVELGFGNANNTTDRTWALLFNTSNSFITTPDISAAPTVYDEDVNESLSISESVTVVKRARPAPSESLTIAETLTSVRLANVDVVETLTLAEALAGGQRFPVGVSEALTVAEAIAALYRARPAPSESLTVSEALGAVALRNVDVSESLTLAAQIAGGQRFAVAVSDTALALAESVAAVYRARPAPAEALGLAEAVSALYTAHASLVDSLALAESAAVVARARPAVAEVLALAEAVSVLSDEVELAESLGITEELTALVRRVVAVAEALTIAESVTSAVDTPPPSSLSGGLGVSRSTTRGRLTTERSNR